ncbi:hypothetical protein [Streptomyces sp. BPTC-684]|uniref:hypothetical protein n=1 Tax=Streptomyces sp. BPTC-684 TaxID=3043734 RepID=UPI0024B05618|nr:hypothetical protein [Streptomyces sp. BPTC-684]WHM36979.1 hypothetical protein QIY60_08800 [Streptomyces sp. BPTC-684]
MARNQAGGARRGRALLRAALTATAAGAALAGATGAAQAAPGDLPAGLSNSLAPAKTLSLNPLAKTPVDPLGNAVGTQIADFKPISTAIATAPLHESGALKDFPAIGTATRLLPG